MATGRNHNANLNDDAHGFCVAASTDSDGYSDTAGRLRPLHKPLTRSMVQVCDVDDRFVSSVFAEPVQCDAGPGYRAHLRDHAEAGCLRAENNSYRMRPCGLEVEPTECLGLTVPLPCSGLRAAGLGQGGN